ncbi:hypothetical protein OQI_00995 [Streptomyces pharetrae CZA14]|uniref:Uncharacterized protein n=1 Tax=Streptomyces pharetrae CZA14 TaxID=1144883 RepID=A0ABX3YU89_9ACTN|nr:hypothetical protein OQI_00995 [Streptomyces pharetrae CZA14]
MDVTPAAFAPPGAEHGGAELVAYGFPHGYDEGMLASYRALPGPLISGGRVQPGPDETGFRDLLDAARER